jgi:8-amino-7-oxononanoate synthase
VSPVLDFTSALYLGLRHPSWSLRPWAQLTTGTPAVLRQPSGAGGLAQKLAALQGCEAATLGRSTLHLFWDLFGMLGRCNVAIYMDACLYPIGQWGIERAATYGAMVRSFAHHDPGALRCLVEQDTSGRFCPIVVTDGYCPDCGRVAPIVEYLETVRKFGGLLVLDDTQALGILGHSPAPDAPYGRTGGGSLLWTSIGGPDVLIISSLAKGFGAPIAALCGGASRVRWFEANAETRVHCSPPSFAAIHAAEHALALNQEKGDTLRGFLAQLVRYFQRRLADAGFFVKGGLFPVQTLVPMSGLEPPILHGRLLRAGIRSVLRDVHGGSGPRISFLLTARHSVSQVGNAVDVLTRAAQTRGRALKQHNA